MEKDNKKVRAALDHVKTFMGMRRIPKKRKIGNDSTPNKLPEMSPTTSSKRKSNLSPKSSSNSKVGGKGGTKTKKNKPNISTKDVEDIFTSDPSKYITVNPYGSTKRSQKLIESQRERVKKFKKDKEAANESKRNRRLNLKPDEGKELKEKIEKMFEIFKGYYERQKKKIKEKEKYEREKRSRMTDENISQLTEEQQQEYENKQKYFEQQFEELFEEGKQLVNNQFRMTNSEYIQDQKSFITKNYTGPFKDSFLKDAVQKEVDQENKDLDQWSSIMYYRGTSNEEPFYDNNTTIWKQQYDENGKPKYNHYVVNYARKGNETKGRQRSDLHVEYFERVLKPEFLGIVRLAKGIFVPINIGRQNEEFAPPSLLSQVKCNYQQQDLEYCITMGLASALHYIGYTRSAEVYVQHSEEICAYPGNLQIKRICELASIHMPEIGKPRIFNQRTRRNSSKKSMTWHEVFVNKTKYPTLVIPFGKDGSLNHSFCIVDDLIFDSTQTHALKLNRESVDWICGIGGAEEKAWGIYRFDQSINGAVFKRNGMTQNWGEYDPTMHQETFRHSKNRPYSKKKFKPNYKKKWRPQKLVDRAEKKILWNLLTEEEKEIALEERRRKWMKSENKTTKKINWFKPKQKEDIW